MVNGGPTANGDAKGQIYARLFVARAFHALHIGATIAIATFGWQTYDAFSQLRQTTDRRLVLLESQIVYLQSKDLEQNTREHEDYQEIYRLIEQQRRDVRQMQIDYTDLLRSIIARYKNK